MAVFAPIKTCNYIEYFVKTQKILKTDDFVEVTKKDGTLQIVRICDEEKKINGSFWYSFETATNTPCNENFWEEFIGFLETTIDSLEFEKRVQKYNFYNAKHSTPAKFYYKVKNAISKNYKKHWNAINQSKKNW